MKKQFKYLAAAGLIAALLLAAGCGDDAKDKKKVDKPDIKTEQKVDKKAQAPVVKPPEGKYYRYPSYLDDVTKTPEMTPEMIKYVDDFASTVKLAPSEKGKFLNDSRINRPNEEYHRIWLHANGSNHNRNNKFKNSKGKEVYQQEVYHIRMSVKADTKKVTYVEYSVYEQNEAIPDGKSRTIMKKVFK